MEIRAELKKPFTEKERMDFIVDNSHNKGYIIEEVEDGLRALGQTSEERAKERASYISTLHLTRADVFRGIFKATGKTKAYVGALIEALPESTSEEIQTKELARIDFEDSLDFYRGVPIVDILGESLGFTKVQLDDFFETNDYTKLLPEVTPELQPEEKVDADTTNEQPTI